MEIMFVVIGLFILVMMFSMLRLRSRKEDLSKNLMNIQQNNLTNNMDSLSSMQGKMFENAINMKKKMLDDNEEVLREIAIKEADIKKEGVRTTAKAFKEGFTSTAYCKHCGVLIDDDSTFCKKCGKKQ